MPMKLLLHKMWSDLRDVRWPWAAWWLILILQVVCCRLFFHDALFFDPRFVSVVLWVGQILAGTQFVLRLFKLDAIHSPTAFWISRPIRPMSLLVGKVVLALFGLLIPMLIARAACMGLMSLPLVNARDWGWPTAICVFAVALCGVSVWGTTTYWRSGLVCGVLALLIVLGPKGIISGWDYIIHERAFGVSGISRYIWVVVGLLDDAWRVLWLSIGGITLVSSFLLLILGIACARRRPVNAAAFLLGVLTLNAGWMLMHFDRKFEPPVAKLSKSRADNMAVDRGNTVHLKIPDLIPTKLVQNTKGESKLNILIKLPPIPGIPKGIPIGSAVMDCAFNLPLGSSNKRLVDFRLNIDADEQLISRKELVEKGFPASEVDAFLKTCPPMLNGTISPGNSTGYRAPVPSSSRVGSLVLRADILRHELGRVSGPINPGGGKLLTPGVRINFGERDSSLCFWPVAVEPPERFSNFMEIIKSPEGRFSGLNFTWIPNGSTREVYAFNTPVINASRFDSLTSIVSASWGGDQPVDRSNADAYFFQMGPQQQVQLVIEAEFELPESWWGIDLK